MSKIVLTRVDSRLIHGQVVTKWLQQSGANEIFTKYLFNGGASRGFCSN